jgi:hypothetical protein
MRDRVVRVTAAVIFLVTWGLTTHGKYSVTGDEPHYLMVAQSLLADHDLDVANNYAANDGAAFGASGVKPEQHIRQNNQGRTLPVHDIGVPIVLAPVLAAAKAVSSLPGDATLRRFRMNRGLFAYSLVSLFIIGMSTCAAAMTMRALHAAGASETASAVIVGVAWLSPPVLSNAFLVFPEPLALLVTAGVVFACCRPGDGWEWRDSVAVAALGAMPWLHRKFAVYAMALLAILLWRRATALRALSAPAKVRIAMLFAVLPIAMMAWTFKEWGNVAGPLALDGLPLSSSVFARGAAGLLVDRENGLIWWAPVYAILPAAFWIRRGDLWPWVIVILALVIPCAAHDQWWAGFSPAGRFLVPLVPIFCLCGVELARRRALQVAAGVLLLPQLLLTAYAWNHPRLLWPQGDGENRVLAALLPPLSAAYRAIPSLRTEPESAWAVTVGLLTAILVLNAALVFYDGSFVDTINAQSRNRRSP